jgi:hypothetical protein
MRRVQLKQIEPCLSAQARRAHEVVAYLVHVVPVHLPRHLTIRAVRET